MPGESDQVFLNIPYDEQFEELYLAFIAGLCALGVRPRATMEIAESQNRLDKIFALMTSCRYSIHDLSRVQLDLIAPRVPRFNMPFELGLMLGWRKARRRPAHDWFVFEEKPHRLLKSLSDLNGIDPLIHGGTVTGVFRGIKDAFARPGGTPGVPEMRQVFDRLQEAKPELLDSEGASTIFGASIFRRLVVAATGFAQEAL